jgi:hypothetical protein
MVKEKPLNLIINRAKNQLGFRMSYDMRSGNIELPDMSKSGRVNEERLNWQRFIVCFTHEFLHKWIHENISRNACIKWDNADRFRTEMPISGLLFDYKRKV